MAPRPRPEVEAMRADDEPDESPGERLVKLNADESPFPPSPAVMAAIRDVEPERLRAYPSSSPHAFREAAAALHGLSPSNVIAGNGCDDLLAIVTRAFIAPGGRVASPSPTYPHYSTLCRISGADYATTDWRDDFTLPVAELLALRADAIYLANPNVPTGTAVAAETLGDLASRFKGLLVIDEACVDFADENAIGLLAEHENVVICRSLSKGYALAGLRFGYALAHADVIAHLMKVKDRANVSALSQAAAVAALGDQSHAGRIWQHVREERARLTLELQLMGFAVLPSQANFVFARHPDSADAGVLVDGLRKLGVLVRHWTQADHADALRITIGTSEENNAFLAALTSLMSKGEPASRQETST